MPISETYNQDCIQGMKHYADNYFELAIVDPPYGLNMAKERPRKDGRFAHNKPRKWDEKIPNQDYFFELFRVTKNQIIWGGNYFPLPPHRNFVFWYKHNPVPNFSDGELAWTSFNYPSKCFDYRYYGNLEGNSQATKKIHISQKPVKLYEWLLMNYAESGDKILDTHLGSGSSRIAAHNLGFDFVGFEIDKEYYENEQKRFKQITAQTVLFKQ